MQIETMNIFLKAIGIIYVIINSTIVFGDGTLTSSTSSSSSLYSTPKPILIIGSTGRVGKEIIKKLKSQGIRTKILVRKEDDKILFDNNDDVVIGDVTNFRSILEATKDVDAVISVAGMKPPRLSKLSDFFTHPSKDLSHPYNVNYLGTKNIVDACKLNGCKKIVRLTGALTGKPCYLPFVVLFNLILSMSPKWHEASESYLRQSGINYTCVRPTELKNDDAAKLTDRRLILIPGDSGKKPPIPGMISIQDVADLCILSATDPKFDHSSVICSSSIRSQDEYEGWTQLSDKLQLKDYKELKLQKHTLTALLSGFVFLGFAASILSCIGLALTKLLAYALRIWPHVLRGILGWKKVVEYAIF